MPAVNRIAAISQRTELDGQRNHRRRQRYHPVAAAAVAAGDRVVLSLHIGRYDYPGHLGDRLAGGACCGVGRQRLRWIDPAGVVGGERALNRAPVVASIVLNDAVNNIQRLLMRFGRGGSGSYIRIDVLEPASDAPYAMTGMVACAWRI